MILIFERRSGESVWRRLLVATVGALVATRRWRSLASLVGALLQLAVAGVAGGLSARYLIVIWRDLPAASL